MLHLTPNWHGETRFHVQVCMYDDYSVLEETCVRETFHVRVKQVDDLPVVFCALEWYTK